MALITTKEMFEKAIKGGYAVGAFNVNNMEIIQGIAEAAKEEHSPVIMQVSAGARKYAKPAYLRKLVEAAMEDTGIDVALHLDHGAGFDICKQCIDDGFTSVMYDGSSLTYNENIEITKKGLPAKVYSTLPAGMETTVKVNLGNDILTSVVFGIIDYKVDEKVNIDFKGNGIILFDKESTNRLVDGKLEIKK